MTVNSLSLPPCLSHFHGVSARTDGVFPIVMTQGWGVINESSRSTRLARTLE